MKRLLKCLTIILLIAAFAAPTAFAGAGDTAANSAAASGGTKNASSGASSSAAESTAVTSQPKLMVYAYSLDCDYLSAGDTGTLSVSVYNTSDSRQIRNLKMSFSVDDHEIIPVEMGTKYLKRIKATGWYDWQFDIMALEKATSGVHPATVTMEYEDSDGNAYTATDTLIITVRQSVILSYDEPALDARLTQGDTPTFSMNLMNTGKSTIYNALLTFDIPGISNGGSVLVGTIEAGESNVGTTNLRVDTDTIGKVDGKVTLSYEDDFGQKYTKELPLSTTVEKKVVAEAPVEMKEESKLSVKHIAIIAVISAVALLVIILMIVKAVKKRREQEEDEKRL
ncbi:MAG: hypothetical protein Q4P20_03620 [Eubacteriales bacterium]|nr:hypothetical protein [Eubacteriales bacterium]